jgi:hypothetical protein
MKRFLNKLIIMLLLAVTYTQVQYKTPNEKIVLSPIVIGSPKTYTGISRLDITSNLSMKLVIQQDVKLKVSATKKIKSPKLSTYSPRLITETKPVLELEIKKELPKQKISFLKAKHKKIIIENVQISTIESKKNYSYNEININEQESVITNNLIKHTGFKNKKHIEISWSSLLEKNNIKSKLEKLAKNEENEIKERIALLKKSEDDKQLALIENKKKAFQFESTIDDMAQGQKVTQLETDKKDDLVFIDYSENDHDSILVNQVEELLSTQPAPVAEVVNDLKMPPSKETITSNKKLMNLGDDAISNMVKSVISREMKNHKMKPIIAYHAPVGPVLKKNTKKEVVSPKLAKKRNLTKPTLQVDILPTSSGYSYKTNAPKNKNSIRQDVIKTALSAPEKLTTQQTNSRTTISLEEISFNKGPIGVVENFEFATAHDMNLRLADEGTGFVNLDVNLKDTHSVYRGTFLKRGMMRTIVNLILEPGAMSVEVPIFSQEAMADLLNKQKIAGHGGFLLVEIDENIDTIDVDTNYEAKVLFNEKYVEVDAMADTTYILYLGVVPGNSLLKIKTVNSHYAEKVIHIVENEVLVESPYTVDPEEQKLILMERNIFAKEKKELELFGSEIKFFNRDIKASQEALNMFTMKLPALVMGMRKYFEFTHLGETVYLGTWNKEEVEVPSRDFIENVMASMEIETLKGRCLLQLNLEKEVRDIKIGGDSVKGPMNLDYAYLDQDGTMSQEVSELVQKAFFIGELQGLINIEVDYLDNTKEYVQTFCSDETYLVEQL